jgi:hypothetical protein
MCRKPETSLSNEAMELRSSLSIASSDLIQCQNDLVDARRNGYGNGNMTRLSGENQRLVQENDRLNN